MKKVIKKFWLLFLLFGITMAIFPLLITQTWFPEIYFNQADGLVGDTLGGTTAPIIGFFGVILTFLAFYVQYDANKQLRKDIKTERFENKFYEMIRLHKENVNELEIADRHRGRKAFVKMYQELRFIYFLLSYRSKQLGNKISKREKTRIAYTFFFFGTGKASEWWIKGLTKHKKLIVDVDKELRKVQDKFWKEHEKLSDSNKAIINHPFEIDYPSKKNKQAYLETTFYPFDGHVSKLGHYYRHLYQTIKYAATNKGIKEKYRYPYVRMLRAQLSNHEQTMIYYNSFFLKGEIWWADKSIDKKKDGTHISYFLDYKLIKNLPFNLTDFGVNPEVYFNKRLYDRGLNKKNRVEEIKKLFEWKEDF